MKQYIQPKMDVQEVQIEQMIASSPNGANNTRTNGSQLGNGRRDVWSNGWDD